MGQKIPFTMSIMISGEIIFFHQHCLINPSDLPMAGKFTSWSRSANGRIFKTDAVDYQQKGYVLQTNRTVFRLIPARLILFPVHLFQITVEKSYF